jgi:hypothetical protein
MSPEGDGPRPGPAFWVLAAAVVGLVASGLFSSLLHWRRGAFVAGYAVLMALYLAGFLRFHRLDPLVQLRRHWRAGVAVGVLLGLMLVRGVTHQPASARPEGVPLFFAVGWLGVVHGALNALLLNILPVVATYGARPAEALRRAGARAQWGAVAVAGSLIVTAGYYLGFEEFRGPFLIRPLIGNAMLTAGYLFSGSPLAPLIGHILMHLAAVWRGMETLPPYLGHHYS